MTMTTAFVVALILGILSGSAAAQIAYVGSTTIGEGLIPEAAKAFTAKTGIPSAALRCQAPARAWRWSCEAKRNSPVFRAL